MQNRTARPFLIGSLEAGLLASSLVAASVLLTGCAESADGVLVADRDAVSPSELESQKPATDDDASDPDGPSETVDEAATAEPPDTAEPSDTVKPSDTAMPSGAAKPSDRVIDRPANPNVIDRSSRESAKARGEINFDDLKFPIAADQPFEESLLTDGVRELDGRKVKIRGYILPTNLFTSTGITRFILVRDNQECCFGPGAALYDCVVVDLDPTAAIDFVTRPITVTGKFGIDTKSYAYPGGVGPKGATHLAIFHIDGESAE